MPRCTAPCCSDLVIDLADLLFPERMSLDGQEFVFAHGLDFVTLGALRREAQLLPTGDVKVFHRCQWLTDDALCAIYDHRPKICRDFSCATRSDCTQPDGLIIPLTLIHEQASDD